MNISVISMKLCCIFLNHWNKQHIYAKQSEGESHDHNMIMIITWLWCYSRLDRSTLIPIISRPLIIKLAHLCGIVTKVCAQVCAYFIMFASLSCISFTRVSKHYMKFVYKNVNIFVRIVTSLLTFELFLFFLTFYWVAAEIGLKVLTRIFFFGISTILCWVLSS